MENALASLTKKQLRSLINYISNGSQLASSEENEAVVTVAQK
jgi:hypothetical protein